MKHKLFFILAYNGSQIGNSGESLGSRYNMDKVCPACGTYARLRGNLVVKGIEKTKKDFSPLVRVCNAYLTVGLATIVHWLKSGNLREVQYMCGHKYVIPTGARLQRVPHSSIYRLH
jgi:hypothetical protein